jgi:hypothetical protein
MLKLQPAKAMDRAQEWLGSEATFVEKRRQSRRTPVHPLDGPSRSLDSDRRLGLGRRWDDWRRP